MLVSIPQSFHQKFAGFVNNLNVLNNDDSQKTVRIEEVYINTKPEFVAVPKTLEKKSNLNHNRRSDDINSHRS